VKALADTMIAFAPTPGSPCGRCARAGASSAGDSETSGGARSRWR
jgi:hypothetical protein